MIWSDKIDLYSILPWAPEGINKLVLSTETWLLLSDKTSTFFNSQPQALANTYPDFIMKFIGAVTIAILAAVANASPAPAPAPAPAANACAVGEYYLSNQWNVTSEAYYLQYSWPRLFFCELLQWISLHEQEPHHAVREELDHTGIVHLFGHRPSHVKQCTHSTLLFSQTLTWFFFKQCVPSSLVQISKSRSGNSRLQYSLAQVDSKNKLTRS
jgi:hypothetical protein